MLWGQNVVFISNVLSMYFRPDTITEPFVIVRVPDHCFCRQAKFLTELDIIRHGLGVLAQCITSFEYTPVHTVQTALKLFN